MLDRLLLPSVLLLFVIKIISINLTSFNLFGDEAQYWLWSKDIDFGYFSKPPFLSWVIRIYSEVIGDSFVSLKLLPSFVYFLIAWGIYSLFVNIGLDEKNSLLGSFVFLFIPAVSFSSFIVSTDLFLLLFWTLSLNELIKIIRYKRTQNFILIGIFLGLAFLSKYAAVYFIICLVFLVILDKEFRGLFFKNYFGFSISFLCLILIILPNIIWNLNNNWITLQHTSDNANLKNLKINFYRGLEFLLLQALMLGPFLFVSGILPFRNVNKFQKVLLIFSLPIILIVFIEAVIVRANANWAAPGLVSLFVFLYIGFHNFVLRVLNFLFNFFFCAIFFMMIGTSYPSDLFSRITGLNKYANEIYSLASKNMMENIVISDRLLFSSISYELRDKNISFYMPHKNGDRITNHFKMKSPLDKNIDKNFIFIGDHYEINYLKKNHVLIKKNLSSKKVMKKNFKVYEVVFD